MSSHFNNDSTALSVVLNYAESVKCKIYYVDDNTHEQLDLLSIPVLQKIYDVTRSYNYFENIIRKYFELTNDINDTISVGFINLLELQYCSNKKIKKELHDLHIVLYATVMNMLKFTQPPYDINSGRISYLKLNTTYFGHPEFQVFDSSYKFPYLEKGFRNLTRHYIDKYGIYDNTLPLKTVQCDYNRVRIIAEYIERNYASSNVFVLSESVDAIIYPINRYLSSDMSHDEKEQCRFYSRYEYGEIVLALMVCGICPIVSKHAKKTGDLIRPSLPINETHPKYNTISCTYLEFNAKHT